MQKLLSAVILGTLLIGCTQSATPQSLMTFQLTSPAFTNGEKIPALYTCDGEDRIPDLVWSDAPQNTQSFALIMDDPDAPMGTWVHWVIYNLPSGTTKITNGALPEGAMEGMNSWDKTAYGGPCPPSGTHRYIFHLYALDTMLDLLTSGTKEELEQAMQNHVLAQTELIGVYQR